MWTSVRTDTRGEFSTGQIVGVVFGVTVAIMVGLILVPPLANQTYLDSKNVTTAGNATRTAMIPGSTGLLPLVGLMFLVAVIAISIVGALYLLNRIE